MWKRKSRSHDGHSTESAGAGHGMIPETEIAAGAGRGSRRRAAKVLSSVWTRASAQTRTALSLRRRLVVAAGLCVVCVCVAGAVVSRQQSSRSRASLYTSLYNSNAAAKSNVEQPHTEVAAGSPGVHSVKVVGRSRSGGFHPLYAADRESAGPVRHADFETGRDGGIQPASFDTPVAPSHVGARLTGTIEVEAEPHPQWPHRR